METYDTDAPLAVLRTAALATTALAAPFVRGARAAGECDPERQDDAGLAHQHRAALARPAAA